MRAPETMYVHELDGESQEQDKKKKEPGKEGRQDHYLILLSTMHQSFAFSLIV